ncbi:hypothetical protein [Wukongibacter sp. M2B1]|uniref:hypothetical protein n=1 Tax=Wukongibacter sp. M2B1 TaxID=3088895 RepID=UPI003D7A6164
MKKILTLILILTLMIGITATNVMAKEIEYNLATHEELIKLAQQDKNNVLDEYQILESQKKELAKKSLLKTQMNESDLVEIEKELLEGFKERTNLNSEELKKIGYNDREINELSRISNLPDNIILKEASAKGLLAKCTVYSKKLDHHYSSSNNQTHFRVRFGWSWDKMPLVWIYNDTIGIGWNGDFKFEDGLLPYYNHLKITYNDDLGLEFTDSYKLKEVEINTASVKFPMSKEHPDQDIFAPYAKDGEGYVGLVQIGKMENAKLAFKYGHNTIGGDIKITKAGIAFGFKGANYTFAPEVINSQEDF